MAAPNRKNCSARNFPTIPNQQLWANQNTDSPVAIGGWWHINFESRMACKIDENGDHLPSGINHEATTMEEMLANCLPVNKWPALHLRAKPIRLMFENYGRNLIPSEDIGDNDILWESQGLNYLKHRIFFAEENACPDWKQFHIRNATWEECIFQWRRIGKVIRQFGLSCGSDQYEEYFVDAVEHNHQTRHQIYAQVANLEDIKATLTGKDNKKKRNSTNKKIKELRKNARSIPIAPKVSLNKAAPDFEIRKKLFVKTEKQKNFRYCSWCEKGMQNWQGCPCKTVWYCDETCQHKDWKKGKHKKVCSFRKKNKRRKN